MRPHPKARRWREPEFRKSTLMRGPMKHVKGRSIGKRKVHSEMTTSGYLNHWAFLMPGGLVVVTVYGGTETPWEWCSRQADRYGLNPDGTTYPWAEGTDRRG